MILSARVLKALKSESADDTHFSRALASIYSKMGKMELHKYLPPKLSQCCTKLAVYCATIYPLSQTDSLDSFSPSKFEHELPKIQEVPRTKIRKPAKSTIQTREKSNYSPFRAPSSTSYYEKIMEKYQKQPRHAKAARASPGESVQLNDGMFYRLI